MIGPTSQCLLLRWIPRIPMLVEQNHYIFFVFFEHNLTPLCRAYLHFCLFDCAWSSMCILQGLTSLRLSSHQVGLLLSSIWVQATIPGNTPTNFEAMAHTYKVALFFSRAKVSVSFPAALWMSFVHV